MMAMGMLYVGYVYAQDIIASPVIKTIEPLRIEATFEQTTNILFPFAVQSADWGSSALIVQQRKGAGNILHVKAARRDFSPTNLSVVSSDGRFYSFLVHYVEYGSGLSYVMQPSDGRVLAGVDRNEASLKAVAGLVRRARANLRLSRGDAFSRLSLQGVYTDSTGLWFRLRLRNHSPVDFRVDYVGVFLRDTRSTRKKAVYEKRLPPIYSEFAPVVGSKRDADILLAFDPFTVARDKRLVLQLSEDAGGRSLTLRVKGRHLLRARKLGS